MGTGKTRTALELVARRFNAGKTDSVLWLCPCSVKESLNRDIKKHLVSGGESIRIEGIESLSSSIRLNSELLQMVQNNKVFLIVDESNLVKNHKAKRTERIVRLASFCKYKLILNGTPISRCEKDLFSQWYILDWRILGYQSFWSFAANHLEYDENIHGKINRVLNVDYLVRKIAPYTYQVRKEECLDLPEKTYETCYYRLTDAQDDHYQEVANELMFDLDELEPHTIYRLFTGLQNVISGFRVTNGEHLVRAPFFSSPLKNPRIQKLLDVIEGIEQKVIIFCKYTSEIEAIIQVINNAYGEGAAVPFYGELTQKQRQNNLGLFENSAQFLVANKTCAGYGLNLQYCSYIIYYSNDWDYATRIQSEDRVHRIGQEKNVHIVNICAAETLDERILRCLRRKENLVESFNNEIKHQNDIRFVEKFIYKKNHRGRTFIKGTSNEVIKEENYLKDGE